MDKEVALYIHIPFCKQKCLYCDFPSFSGKENLMDEYTDALCREIDGIEKVNIKTIFIGGGTPTYLSLKNWEKIRCSLDKLSKTKTCEFTIEGNPGSFTKEKLKFFKGMGVNRLSIGLQAWQNALLKKIGRIHDIEQFMDTYNTARSIGFENINIDIMFGLPNQNISDWKETLEEVIKLNPEHISCYGLIIEEGTPFYKMYEENTLNLPDEEVEREMYHAGLNMLSRFGYKQYEISNFSKPGRECRHNLIYWELGDYIGCGSGAHSYINGFRYRNTDEIKEYILKMDEKGCGIVESHKNSVHDDMEEFMFMGLRKINGISINEFNSRFDTDIFQIYGEVIAKHKETGMLIEEDKRLYLSSLGIEFSNNVMSDFIFLDSNQK